jgi:hypothetical protein
MGQPPGEEASRLKTEVIMMRSLMLAATALGLSTAGASAQIVYVGPPTYYGPPAAVYVAPPPPVFAPVPVIRERAYVVGAPVVAPPPYIREYAMPYPSYGAPYPGTVTVLDEDW